MKITKGALPLILGNYASNYNINLYMKGSFAYTNGNSIVIPRLHLDDHDSLEMAYGFVAHECGHIRYSDFSLLSKITGDRLTFTLFNAIEDPRIEYLQTKDWPGLAHTFNFLVEQLKNLSLNCIKRNQKNTNNDCTALLMLFCNYCLRYKEVGQKAAQELYTASKKFLAEKIGRVAVRAIEKMLQGTTKAKDSKEVLDIARRILDFVCKITNLSIPNNDGNDATDFNDDEAMINLKNTNESSLTDNDYDDAILQEIKAEFDSIPEKFTSITLSANATENLALINYGVKEYLSDKSDDVDIDEEFGMMQAGIPVPREDSDLLMRVRQNPKLMINLRELIKGHELWDNGFSTHGDLISLERYDRFRHRINVDNRIFTKKNPRRAMNTSIHLLVDSSGSMYSRCHSNNRYRFEIANEVALSLALACEGQKKLDTSVTYFPGQMTEFETVTTAYNSAYSRAAYFDQRPKGGTPMAQALMHAIYGFTSAIGKRNIILLITDGDPDNPKAVADLLETAKKMNVEVYTIRIGNNTCCPDLFPVSRTVEDCAELPDAVYSMLSDSMFHQSNQ